jgi:hypothetical protein
LKGQGKTSQEWLKLTAERLSKAKSYLEKRKERVKPTTELTQQPRPSILPKYMTHIPVIEEGRKYIGDELPSLYSQADYVKFKEIKKGVDARVRRDSESYSTNRSPANRKQLVDSMDYQNSIIVKSSDQLVPAMTRLRNKLLADSAISKDVADLMAQSIEYSKSASSQLPKGKAQEIMADFFQITNGKGRDTLGLIEYSDERATARPGRINIGSSPDDHILFHEMGHHIEYSDKSAYEIASNWRTARGLEFASKTDRPNTVRAVSLSQLTGDKNYTDHEVAIPDEFHSPYVGRSYSQDATEVISTGLEHFHSPEAMAKFYVQDPEHFELIIGIIRGNQS